ncbi:hypothetical protein H696_00646 [Fonticula alba]|uniref:Uncharacterized protein n=1 Tax=Fonticula alba TaxID=691883 RepID=A0A058ZGK6_FONAL|nr:hypothetical protein H696_00646 [Fonticula alba]KCV73101.1 hypothetical protein H696_00646 [Fonticula alba]|eukprot:XP_009492802.1 hypothetical protein H696_00646 [Fonticula alba]
MSSSAPSPMANSDGPQTPGPAQGVWPSFSAHWAAIKRDLARLHAGQTNPFSYPPEDFARSADGSPLESSRDYLETNEVINFSRAFVAGSVLGFVGGGVIGSVATSSADWDRRLKRFGRADVDPTIKLNSLSSADRMKFHTARAPVMLSSLFMNGMVTAARAGLFCATFFTVAGAVSLGMTHLLTRGKSSAEESSTAAEPAAIAAPPSEPSAIQRWGPHLRGTVSFGVASLVLTGLYGAMLFRRGRLFGIETQRMALSQDGLLLGQSARPLLPTGAASAAGSSSGPLRSPSENAQSMVRSFSVVSILLGTLTGALVDLRAWLHSKM